MPEGLTPEMENEIINALLQDIADMQRIAQTPYHAESRKLPYHALEQLSYITEQFRLKLRMLGAPRIYQ